jgi:hypothetical protein
VGAVFIGVLLFSICTFVRDLYNFVSEKVIPKPKALTKRPKNNIQYLKGTCSHNHHKVTDGGGNRD